MIVRQRKYIDDSYEFFFYIKTGSFSIKFGMNHPWVNGIKDHNHFQNEITVRRGKSMTNLRGTFNHFLHK